MQRTWLKPTLGIATGVGIYTAPYSISERRRRYNELIQRGYTPAQADKMSQDIGYWGNFYAGYQRNKIVNQERKRYNKQALKNNQFRESKKINKKQ